jgi:hypothetical protein
MSAAGAGGLESRPEADYTEWGLRGFPQSLHVNFLIIPLNSLKSFLPIPFLLTTGKGQIYIKKREVEGKKRPYFVNPEVRR